MSNLEKLKFPALDLAGANYITWALEARNYLCADGLDETIQEDFNIPTGNSKADQDMKKKASQTICLLLRHLHADLKTSYLEERNPAIVWKKLITSF